MNKDSITYNEILERKKIKNDTRRFNTKFGREWI